MEPIREAFSTQQSALGKILPVSLLRRKDGTPTLKASLAELTLERQRGPVLAEC